MVSAIVATLFLVPVALIGLACALVAGTSPLTLLSFGGALPAPLGLLAIWVVLLVPASIYVALVLRH